MAHLLGHAFARKGCFESASKEKARLFPRHLRFQVGQRHRLFGFPPPPTNASADRVRPPRAYDGLMRTTLTLDPDIAKKLKTLTAERGTPFNEIVNESLRLGLALNRPVRRPKKFRVAPFALEFMPGIDSNKLNQLADELEDL